MKDLFVANTSWDTGRKTRPPATLLHVDAKLSSPTSLCAQKYSENSQWIYCHKIKYQKIRQNSTKNSKI